MQITAAPATLDDIAAHRDLYRQEMNCQIVHDRHHERGFTAIYQLRIDGRVAGYGCVGTHANRGRETVKEFYVLPDDRGAALPLFRALLAASGATRIEAQTNDRLLMLMLWDCCTMQVESETVLFEDAATTRLPAPAPGAIFRKLREGERERVFEHHHEPVGDWVIEVDGTIAATGGFLCHYNPPYGDVFMEVAAPFRGRGLGSYLVQEVKRVCYEAGKRPAARCNVTNHASRRTLQKAGFLPCARIVAAACASAD